MNEHLQELKIGGRPMTKLELLQKENEKLNNIINGLEEYLQQNIINIYVYFDNAPFGIEETYKEVLNKLQELKGSDNNGIMD